MNTAFQEVEIASGRVVFPALARAGERKDGCCWPALSERYVGGVAFRSRIDYALKILRVKRDFQGDAHRGVTERHRHLLHRLAR